MIGQNIPWVPHIPVEYTLLMYKAKCARNGHQHLRAATCNPGFYGYLVDFSGHEATGRAQIIGTWFEF